MEFHFEWFFYFSCDTASNVGTHIPGVSNCEAGCRLDCYSGFHSVELSHALDFSEDYNIPVIQSMLLLIMQTHQSNLLLGDSCDVNAFSLLSSGVKYSVSLAKINKCVAIKTKISRQ